MSKITLRIQNLSEVSKDILKKRWPQNKQTNDELQTYVKAITEKVRKEGDKALIDFTREFDRTQMPNGSIRVTKEEIKKAYSKASREQIAAINFTKKRVQILEKGLLERLNFKREYEGVRVNKVTRPIQSVGCYVPGGEASYPSTLIMTVVTAKTAGVPRVIVCSPPTTEGKINPLTLAAADICGADEVYAIGGAQAIAALAYGTETIRPVEKIVGPGNKYVLAAKMLISTDVLVDLPAGPSEILVLADDSGDPETIALDMISQAEHGTDGVSILVSTSTRVAKAVAKEISRLVDSCPNKDTVVEALARNGAVLASSNINEALRFVNDFAPEHLEIMTEDALQISERVSSAGLVLIGKYTPVSASDYCLGTNHVLPTGGFSRVFSGLSVLDFVKTIDVVECTEEGLAKVRSKAKTLAESEGLVNHAIAIEGRFKK